MRPLRVCTHPVLFIVLVPLTISAQQFRQGPPDRAALSKAAVERRLFSKHPVPPADLKKAVPGKYLLDREAARASQLQARIRSTNAPRPLVSATSTTIFPGIQFRPTLPAGSISNAVATGDFNLDGKEDFIMAMVAPTICGSTSAKAMEPSNCPELFRSRGARRQSTL